MKAKFLKINDPLLKKKSKKIPLSKITSLETKNIINTMLKIACRKQKDSQKPVMVGLAAPQIGILERIILVDVKADGKGKVGNLRVYINPEITWQSKTKGEWYEGCFSTGKICGIVTRPISVRIKAFGVPEQKYTGYVARIFLHEIDHLNGKLFFSHINDPEKLHLVEKKEFPKYRDQQGWKNWPKKPKKPLAFRG